ncbi:MAG TPA: hypothetical protein VK983_01285 [Candidatus Limnocylindrales bacterium]|nr:hypothetical protein [Candidatus Limnocylindrales bacterium]
MSVEALARTDPIGAEEKSTLHNIEQNVDPNMARMLGECPVKHTVAVEDKSNPAQYIEVTVR